MLCRGKACDLILIESLPNTGPVLRAKISQLVDWRVKWLMGTDFFITVVSNAEKFRTSGSNICTDLSHLQNPIKSLQQKKYICEHDRVWFPLYLGLYVKLGLSQRTQGEKQKSTERPVINSFTVIKTLESLKGVKPLMSCDISEAPLTQDYTCHCALHIRRQLCTLWRKCSQLD